MTIEEWLGVQAVIRFWNSHVLDGALQEIEAEISAKAYRFPGTIRILATHRNGDRLAGTCCTVALEGKLRVTRFQF